MVRVLAFVGLLVGCGTSTIAQVKRGDAAFARGDLAGAAMSYDEALEDRDEDPWVRAKVEQGRARIELERMRQSGKLAKLTGAPATLWTTVLAERARIAELGGDDALDAQIVGVLGGLATAIIDDAERRMATQPLDASVQVQRVLAWQELPPPLRERGDRVVAHARDQMLAIAQAAGVGRPLTQRVATALAARHGGAALGPGWELAQPFASGSTIDVAASGDCGQLASRLREVFARPGGGKTAVIRVQVGTCVGAFTTTKETRSVAVDVLRPITRTADANVATCGSYSGGPDYSCTISGGYATCNGGSYSPTNCSVSRQSVTSVVGERWESAGTKEVEFERQAGTFEIRGTWTIVRDGRELTGSFGNADVLQGYRMNGFYRLSSEAERARLVKFASFEPFERTIVAELETTLAAQLQQLYADDIAAATQAARDLETAGNRDDADEAWIKVALLGGMPEGRWRERGITSSMIADAFLGTPAPLAVHGRPVARVYAIPPEPRGRTARDRHTLEAALLPVGKRFYGEVGLGTGETSTAMIEGLPYGGTSAGLLQTTFGTAVLGWKRRSPYGLKVFDDLAGRFEGGFVYDSVGESFSSTHAYVAASYAFGVSLRVQGWFGLIAGVRPEAGYAMFGGGSGTYAGVPAFGRVELAVGRFTLAGEYYLPVAGAERSGAALYISRVALGKPGETDRYARFLTIRYDRRMVGATYDHPTDPTRDLTADDIELTSASVSYGIGF